MINNRLNGLLAGILAGILAALALFAGILFRFAAPQIAQADSPNAALDSTHPPASHTPKPSVTPIPPPTLRATSTLWPTLSPGPSVTPVATSRPTPRDWREWPVVSKLSEITKAILENAKQNPNLDVTAFSKVGDCQLTASTFLGGYARGEYRIPPGFETTVEWFSKSMEGESISSRRGLAINSVLNPMFGYAAGYTQCQKDETPLACELRLNRPAIVLIGVGTNWAPGAEISFEKYLREEVDKILASGALPILSTKGDNIEEDWKLNAAIATVAYDYDLPLVNVWKSMQDSPNHGLDTRDNIHLNYYGLMRRNEAWLTMLHQVLLVLEK